MPTPRSFVMRGPDTSIHVAGVKWILGSGPRMTRRVGQAGGQLLFAEKSPKGLKTESPQSSSPCPTIIMASKAMRSTLRMRSDSDLSWPQAARMSRPRGVRIGEA